jgi:hypothetical protein
VNVKNRNKIIKSHWPREVAIYRAKSNAFGNWMLDGINEREALSIHSPSLPRGV